jgi:hypothetical protein
MTARARLVGFLVAVVSVVVVAVFMIQRAGAAESDFYVEPNGRWHVNGETFWYGAPGDIFLVGAGLDFTVDGSSGYAIWRDGVFHFAGDLVGNVRETVHSEVIGLPTDLPIVSSYAFGAAPSFAGYIRDGVAYFRAGSGEVKVIRWADPDFVGTTGQSLAGRPPILVPIGRLRQALADAKGHPLIDWSLLLDGEYTCETEGPGDIAVPSYTSIKGGRIIPCDGDRLLVENSDLADMRVDGPVVTRGDSNLSGTWVWGDDLLVESGTTRLVSALVHGLVDVSPGAEFRMDGSTVDVDSTGIVVKTTEPVLLLDSLVGVRPYRQPMRLGSIVVPDGFGPANVTLIDSRAEMAFPVTCLDLHGSYCEDAVN